jgi:hypothetical protein
MCLHQPILFAWKGLINFEEAFLGAFVSALKKIDFELKEFKAFFFRHFKKKNLKLFLFVY